MPRDENPNMETSQPMNDKATVLDYFAALVRWRKFIILNFLAVTALAVIVSFLLPKWYKATASILPPKDQGLLNLFGMTTPTARSLSLGQRLTGLGSQPLGAYNFLAILKSRSSMEAVAKKFDLVHVYDVSENSMEKAIKELQDNTSFDLQEDNYLTIDVYDKDPQRAAAMANYFIEMLNTISIQLGTQEARNNREFIEKRIEGTKADLRLAEDSLRKYQEISGVVVTPDQAPSSVSAIAELYGMKAKKEVEVGILERTVTPDNAALKELRLELNELNKRLATIPQTGIESIRLYREIVIQQKIFEYLVPLFEQAKIDEQKDVPVILVLDKAIPPEKKFKPKRLILVATAGGLSLIASILIIMGKMYSETLKSHRYKEYEKLQFLFSEVKRNLRIFQRRQ